MIWLFGHWLFLTFGLNSGSGSAYLFWSGSGSDISELAIVAGLVGLLRKHNCETHPCWRIGRHSWIDPTTGTAHTLCRRHHPLGHLTAQGIADAHASAVPSDR